METNEHALIRQIHPFFLFFIIINLLIASFNSTLPPPPPPSFFFLPRKEIDYKSATAMERARDSIRASCSSPFRSSTTAGLPFKRRPTCLPNDGQVGLLSDAVTVPDRAARKEIERQRLRKLLNQGKKKRRRLNGDKLLISPRNGGGGGTTPSTHRHSREPELNPSGLPPIYADVPRKSRSVGNRRKGNLWRSIGFDPQVQHPVPSAPTVVEKSSPSSVQNEIEIEFEIAEVLYGLKKQVSSSDEPLIDDMEKEENQAISVQGCSVEKASSYYTVDTLKDESILMGPKLGIHNQDKAVLKQETSTAEEGFLLCSNLASDGSNLTSEVIHASMEETKNKQPEKFVIDLNEPPPMDSSLEGDGLERLNSDPKVEIKEEVKSVTEMQLLRKMETKDEMLDLDRGIQDDTGNESKQQFQKQQKAYSRPSHPIHMPLRTGHMMAGPLIFPLSQNQTLIANQPRFSVCASSTGNVRLSYPIGAPFLSGKGMHSSGGNSAQLVSFLDRQLHSSQTLYPIRIQQQKQQPFTTQTISSSSQTNVTRQSLYPLHSPNVAVMPSATNSGGCQWRYTEKHDLMSEEMHNSTTPSFSFASPTQRSSTDPAGLALNFSVAQNPVVSKGFLDRPNLGSQLLPADHRLQHRNSEMFQRMNQADSILAVGNSPSFVGQSGFILKSCSAVSPASIGAKVFDTSVTTQNCKLAFAKQNALSARIHLSNSSPLGASRDKPTSVWLQNQQQQMAQTMATSQLKGVQTVNSQHQPPFAATHSNDFSIFEGSLFDKSLHSLRQ